MKSKSLRELSSSGSAFVSESRAAAEFLLFGKEPGSLWALILRVPARRGATVFALYRYSGNAGVDNNNATPSNPTLLRRSVIKYYTTSLLYAKIPPVFAFIEWKLLTVLTTSSIFSLLEF